MKNGTRKKGKEREEKEEKKKEKKRGWKVRCIAFVLARWVGGTRMGLLWFRAGLVCHFREFWV